MSITEVKGRLYESCVRSAMLYGSDMRAVKVEHVRKLERTEMRMVKLIRGVSLKERKTNAELRGRMGIEEINTVLRRFRNRMRWFGHIERKSDDDWVKRCMNWTTGEKGPRGRPKNKWMEVIKDDMKRMGGRKLFALARICRF